MPIILYYDLGQYITKDMNDIDQTAESRGDQLNDCLYTQFLSGRLVMGSLELIPIFLGFRAAFGGDDLGSYTMLEVEIL